MDRIGKEDRIWEQDITQWRARPLTHNNTSTLPPLSACQPLIPPSLPPRSSHRLPLHPLPPPRPLRVPLMQTFSSFSTCLAPRRAKSSFVCSDSTDKCSKCPFRRIPERTNRKDSHSSPWRSRNKHKMLTHTQTHRHSKHMR